MKPGVETARLAPRELSEEEFAALDLNRLLHAVHAVLHLPRPLPLPGEILWACSVKLRNPEKENLS